MMQAMLIFAFMAIAIGLVGNAHAISSDVSISPPKMVSFPGKEVTSLHAGDQIGVESTLTNHGNSETKFTYMVQVLSNNGAPEYFEGLSASLLPSQSFTVTQSWIPKESGHYTVQTFVWDSLTSAVPLTNIVQTPITVG